MEQKKTNNEEIQDSIEFCRDIYLYYKKSEDGRVQPPQSHSPFYSEDTVSSSHRNGSIPMSRLMDVELTDSARAVAFKNILGFILCVLAAFVIARVLNTFVIQPTQVDGISMENTLHDGEHLLMDKISYRFQSPERFDIVIFPFEEDVYYIKRIIGMPEERVQIRDGAVYINGGLLEDDVYGNAPIQNGGQAEEEILLGKNEYFVLGDNRNNSLDSRYEAVGMITEDHMIGKAFLRIYPFKSFGLLHREDTAEKTN